MRARNEISPGFEPWLHFTDRFRLPISHCLVMNTNLHKTIGQVAITCFGLLTGRVTAQTITALYTFTQPDLSTYINSDGVLPCAGLVLAGNTLYGTVSSGGSAAEGSLFAVKTDGTGFTNLHSFTATSGSSFKNSDGAVPLARLILSGATLYGTAFEAVPRATAPYSRSTPMAQVSPPCIVSRH